MTKSAAVYAARGLPDDLVAALVTLGEEGNYSSSVTDQLIECCKRGLLERLEECGENRRAVATPFGREVIDLLLVEQRA